MKTTFCLLLLLGVVACSPDHPFDKPGTWSIQNQGSANDANLRAMIVNPHDLIEGQSASNSLSAEASAPVKRLLTGKRTPLPISGLLQLQLSGDQPQPAAPDSN
jgi:hypothetical protein